MFDAFPAELRAELGDLAAGYGAPLVRVVDLQGGLFDPLHRADRRVGEVCLAIRRPNGALITATKAIYPQGAYRLLTGGVAPGERILDALRREAREETSLETELRRFLAAVAYRRAGALAFVTFAFLLDEVGGTLANADPAERHGGFGETSVSQLEDMAAALESLPDGHDARIGGSWRDWGRFRAVIHRVVAEALSST